MAEDFDFIAFKARALDALQAGKPLTGKDGVLAPLLENLLNAALEGEMDAHMSTDERDAGNRRNGYGIKQVQSSLGELTVQTPRDRDATFDPSLVQSITYWGCVPMVVKTCWGCTSPRAKVRTSGFLC